MNKSEVLIVSPHFPPSTLAGVHRARHLAKHLPYVGWWPIIVCVDETYYEVRLDPGLAALVPKSVEVVRVGAVPSMFTRPFGLGEISLRAWEPLRRAVFRIIASRPIQVVLITGSPFYPMLLASSIRRRFRVPVVLDFQDPWVSPWGAEQPRFSKAGISHWVAQQLEPRAIRGANFITAVSDAQNEEMAKRYPWFDRSRMVGIPIGGDPEDFSALRAVFKPDVGQGSDTFNFSYVGTIWPPVVPTLRTLLRAVARIRHKVPAVYERMRFKFVGTTANPNNTTGYLVRPLAEAEGVADVVFEIPQRLPYLDALRIMVDANAILMIGSDEPHYTASKIFPVLMSGRPYLSVFHRASSAHTMAISAGGGVSLSFASREELPLLEQPLAEALVKLATAPQSVGRTDPAAYIPYQGRAIAQRFATIFDEVARATD